MRRICCLPIDIYRFILSPWVGQNCRFHPTCSCYARGSIMRHGVFKGIFLSIWRILRCNPYYKGNYQDNVPETFEWKDLIRYNKADKKIRKAKDNCCRH
ncbi:MAG: membrane protein insertion efficiency factor YidD [Alphaproteobacteria bacterium]|nr:membrane protein insertion efficiency factor YidD [Alphaproteobacteria bacterium]